MSDYDNDNDFDNEIEDADEIDDVDIDDDYGSDYYSSSENDENSYDTDSSVEEIEEDKHVYKDNAILIKIPDDMRMTSNILSMTEYVNIISTRAQQIANGNTEQPLIFTDGSEILNSNSHTKEEDLAKKEIAMKKCPFKVRRFIPPNFYEEWDVNEMTIITL